MTRMVAVLAAVMVATIVAGCRAEPEILGSIKLSPTPRLPGDAARVAFVESLLADELAYHATIRGSLHGFRTIVELDGTMDAAGQDYQITVAYHFPEDDQGLTGYAYRLVDGVAYARTNDGAWTEDDAFTADETNNPFAFIDNEREIKLIKTDVISGQAFHRLRFERSLLITPRQVPSDNVTQERVVLSWFELTVDNDGAPVEGHWRLEGRARVSGLLQEVIIQADLEYSKVGEAITISAP